MSASPYENILTALGPLVYALVYVFGFVIALTNLSRYRGPAMLALLGCTTVLMMIVGQQLAIRYLTTSSTVRHEMIPAAMSLVAIATAIGNLLIIIAVFAGRNGSSMQDRAD